MSPNTVQVQAHILIQSFTRITAANLQNNLSCTTFIAIQATSFVALLTNPKSKKTWYYKSNHQNTFSGGRIFT